jgi:hypothetical protein
VNHFIHLSFRPSVRLFIHVRSPPTLTSVCRFSSSSLCLFLPTAFPFSSPSVHHACSYSHAHLFSHHSFIHLLALSFTKHEPFSSSVCCSVFLFIRPFIYSLTHPSLPQIFLPFTRSFIHAFICSRASICPQFVCLSILLYTLLLFINLSSHSCIHLFIQYSSIRISVFLFKRHVMNC